MTSDLMHKMMPEKIVLNVANKKGVDSLEKRLLEVGHATTLSDREDVRATGRAIMAMVPGMASFLRGEIDRGGEQGPGMALYGFVRSLAVLAGTLAACVAKKDIWDGDDGRNTLSTAITGLFASDLAELLAMSEIRHESEMDPEDLPENERKVS